MPDYIPQNNAGFDPWQSNLVTYATANRGELGLVDTDLAPLTAAQTAWTAGYAAHVTAQAAAASACTAKDGARAVYEAVIRPLVARIQLHPGTTDAHRASLQITVRAKTAAARYAISTTWPFTHFIAFLALFFLLVEPLPVLADITKDQAIQYIYNTWKITDLSDKVLSQTLDNSYSGLPYKQWIDFLYNAPKFLNPLASGDYSTAAQNAYAYAQSVTFAEAISKADLTGITAPAELAVWPINHVLNDFAQAVNDAAFRNQTTLYFQARAEGNNYQDIVNCQPGDLLPHSLLFKTDQGWLAYQLSYLPSFPAFGTANKFFDYGERLWQAKKADLSSASSLLAN